MSAQNDRNSFLVADGSEDRLPLAEVGGRNRNVQGRAGRKHARGVNLRGPRGGAKFRDLQIAGTRTITRMHVGIERQFSGFELSWCHHRQSDFSLRIGDRSAPLRLDGSGNGSCQLDALKGPYGRGKSRCYFIGGNISQSQPNATFLFTGCARLRTFVCWRRLEPVDDFGVTSHISSEQLRLQLRKGKPLGTDGVVAAQRYPAQSDRLVAPIEVLERKFSGRRKSRCRPRAFAGRLQDALPYFRATGNCARFAKIESQFVLGHDTRPFEIDQVSTGLYPGTSGSSLE